jgi:hypothetical protein
MGILGPLPFRHLVEQVCNLGWLRRDLGGHPTKPFETRQGGFVTRGTFGLLNED